MQGKRTYTMHKVKKHWVTIAGTAGVLSAALLASGPVKADQQETTVVRGDSAAVVSQPAEPQQGQNSQAENQPATDQEAVPETEQVQTDTEQKWQAVDQPSQPEQVAAAVNQAQAASQDAAQIQTNDTQQEQASPKIRDSHAIISKDDAKVVDQGKQTGFYTTGDNAWYYANEDGSLAKGLQSINGQTLYFDTTTGKQVKGDTVKIDGKEYYFDQDTGDMWKDRFRQIDTQDYRGVAPGAKVGIAWLYYQVDGSVASGLTTTPDGRTLMFNTYNHQQVKGKLVNTDGNNYRYFDLNTGDMLRNTSIYDGSQKYNIDANGIATKA